MFGDDERSVLPLKLVVIVAKYLKGNKTGLFNSNGKE